MLVSTKHFMIIIKRNAHWIKYTKIVNIEHPNEKAIAVTPNSQITID